MRSASAASASPAHATSKPTPAASCPAARFPAGKSSSAPALPDWSGGTAHRTVVRKGEATQRSGQAQAPAHAKHQAAPDRLSVAEKGYTHHGESAFWRRPARGLVREELRVLFADYGRKLLRTFPGH